MLDQGRPVLAWSQILSGTASPSAPGAHRGATGAVWMATMTPSGRRDAPVRLSAGGDDVTGAPALAASATGVVAAWPRHLDDANSGWQAATGDLAARFAAPVAVGRAVSAEVDILSPQTVAFPDGPRRWTLVSAPSQRRS